MGVDGPCVRRACALRRAGAVPKRDGGLLFVVLGLDLLLLLLLLHRRLRWFGWVCRRGRRSVRTFVHVLNRQARQLLGVLDLTALVGCQRESEKPGCLSFPIP